MYNVYQTAGCVSVGCNVEFVRGWDQIEPSIYSAEGLQRRGDRDGGIDISEDKSNHLLIKPSTTAGSYTQTPYINRNTMSWGMVLMRALVYSEG